VIPSKLVTTLMQGDRVTVETAGGGGYGAPDQRDPEAHAGDIADGKVSTSS
jgi:N-methylhydantoinase B/oxoprolinase/acetone carboxylase alpha subunit